MSAFAGEDTIKNINFTGGFPGRRDFAPSIVFLIAYAITIPILLLRITRKSDRTVILLRPTLFVAARVGSLILRIIMSRHSYGISSLIAELVLISVGYIFLIDPFIQSWARHVEGNVPRSERPSWVKPLRWTLWGLLLVSIIITVIAGAVTSDAFKSKAWLNSVKGLRQTGYYLTLIVIVFLAIVTIFTHFHFRLPIFKTLYILTPTCCLMIVAIYRIVQTHTTSPNAPVRSLTAFWILQMTFEYIAYLFVIAVSLPRFFPGETVSPTETATERRGSRNKLLHREKHQSPEAEHNNQIASPGLSEEGPDPRWYDRLLVVKFVKWIKKRNAAKRQESQV
ncbi:uncharacterized protein IL334_002525 [Kwoniella shivajii]|uniref:Uncharacterized protein n=1 Tax=Kwoniella shivajii TaxID=564305 RepID=A0ABZ1CVB9_9TREE|nr:hypothetical protein IL334_002525 [Kwoniella shivajii]